MLLFIGLGNPGKEYERTRHNAGRMILKELHKIYKLPDFHFEKKWNAEASEGKIEKEKVIFLLPDTFMNTSGNAASPAMRFFKIKPHDLFVLHDDADILLGSAKLSFNKSSAGHKGVESVMRALKTQKFWRFRIGIAGRRDIPAEKLVLKRLTSQELHGIKKIVGKTARAVEDIADRGPEYAMNSYNS